MITALLCSLLLFGYLVFRLLGSDAALLLSHDAIRKRGLCCRPVSVRSSVTFVYVSRRLKITSNFSLAAVTISFECSDPKRCNAIPRGIPSAEALNTPGGNCVIFCTEIAVYLGNERR